jgi:F-type H+-transporting ATPase subunit delta
MAEALTIARPYAEAAFKLASDAKALPQWSAALSRLAALAANDAMRGLVGNPRLTDGQVATLLCDVAGDLSPEQRNFVLLLATNERLAVLPEIATLYEAQKNASEGVLDARIASAFPLSAAQVDEVVSSLESRYARKVKATVEVDSDLIGGVSIRIGDEVIDASVRGKLAQLADALVK